jgi:hypothetical protein
MGGLFAAFILKGLSMDVLRRVVHSREAARPLA